MSIACNELQQTINSLLIAFKDCNRIKNSDLRKLVDLSVSLYACSNGGGGEIANFQTRLTYALMIADGTPTIPTIYNVENDENKSYERSTYLWKPDGNREWIASTPDN